MYLLALSIGFIGSFHCIGMCGPIALTLPLNRSSLLNSFIGAILYNSGRIVTYAIIGILFGLLGQGFYMAGLQNMISVSIGIFLLIVLILSNKKWKLSSIIFSKLHLLQKIKAKLIQLFGKKSNTGLFLIGTLNGLLPCGLVYLGIAGAITSGNVFQSALFMVLFGLGTLPALLFINLLSGNISLTFRNKIKRMVPLAIGLMAVLLIFRGLNLGIPMISPEMSTKQIEIKQISGDTIRTTICVQDCCKE